MDSSSTLAILCLRQTIYLQAPYANAISSPIFGLLYTFHTSKYI